MRESVAVEQPHMCQVVDGKHGERALLLQVHQGNSRPRMPVVTVQHIGAPVQGSVASTDVRGSTRQQHKALGIIRPGYTLLIEIGVAEPLRKQRVIHQPGQ